MDKARILEKVRKCLALGNNEGASEAERARALAQAGKLLASGNLTMASVGSIIEDRVREMHDLAPELREWPRSAIGGIARLFFCKYYRDGADTKRAKFYYVGKSVNVATCQMMVQYVIINIVKEAKKRANMAKAAELLDGTAGAGEGYGAKWEYAFCLGASEAVRVKCDELIAERERDGIQGEEGSGTALVVYNLAKAEKQKNSEFLKAMGIILTTSTIKAGKDAKAYAAGVAHGKTINLSRQVGNSSGGTLALADKGGK